MSNQQQQKFELEVNFAGNITSVPFTEGDTVTAVYNMVAEQAKMALDDVRVLVNEQTVESEDADTVRLEPGNRVDIVTEISNG